MRGFLLALAIIAMALLAAGCDRRQSQWESARKADTANAYTEFLKRYPEGDFVSQARARLDELKQDADWKNVLGEDSAAGYQHFVDLHPDGAHADEARIRLENLHLAAAPGPLPAGPLAAPAAMPAAAGLFRAQLGAFSSESRARSEWQQASRTYKTELAGLAYTIDKSAKGATPYFRLQTSGISESRARAVCAALKAHGQACVVVLP